MRIGGILVRKLSDGSCWLENEIGEGMQIKSDALEQALLKFFNDNF